MKEMPNKQSPNKKPNISVKLIHFYTDVVSII
jgi:hypothetical protein